MVTMFQIIFLILPIIVHAEYFYRFKIRSSDRDKIKLHRLDDGFLIFNRETTTYIELHEHEKSFKVRDNHPIDLSLVKLYNYYSSMDRKLMSLRILIVIPSLKALKANITVFEWLQATGFDDKKSVRFDRWFNMRRTGEKYLIIVLDCYPKGNNSIQ